jgi:trehalose-6-phosphate synthase
MAYLLDASAFKVPFFHLCVHRVQAYTPLITLLILATISVLWPLFHYVLWQDIAVQYSSADSNYPFYLQANAAFVQRITEVYKPGDVIWVHDYHLLLVPKLLRAKLPDAVIGLFIHPPFPSSEVFRCLPRELLFLSALCVLCH